MTAPDPVTEWWELDKATLLLTNFAPLRHSLNLAPHLSFRLVEEQTRERHCSSWDLYKFPYKPHLKSRLVRGSAKIANCLLDCGEKLVVSARASKQAMDIPMEVS